MWFWIVLIPIVLLILIPRIVGQNAEKKAGFGPKCQHCRSKLKMNPDKTGWARVCRKCGREQVAG